MPRRYSMATREGPVAETRRRIETALVRLLALQSYDAITVAEIAREADVAARTVHRHYASKDEILVGICQLATRQIVGSVQGGPQSKSPGQAIRNLVSASYAFFGQHELEIWAAYSQRPHVEKLAEVFRECLRALESHIEGLIASWPDAWAFEPAMTKRVLVSLIGFGTWREFTQLGGFGPAEAAETVSGLASCLLVRSSPE